MSGRHIARRAVAGSGLAALVLAASAPGQAKAQELDGEILALVHDFKGSRRQIEDLEAIQDKHGSGSKAAEEARQGVRRLVDRGWEIRDRIAELPAKTPEGLRAKAWLALWETCDGEIGSEPVEGD